MTLFLLIFFILYGGMHVYAFIKAKAAFAFSTMAGIFIAAFMLIMIFAPIIVRLSEKTGYDFFARLMSYVGYTWLGILFLFISLSLVFDVYRFILYSGEVVLNKDLSFIGVSNKVTFFVSLALALLITAYGYFEARDVRTETVTVKTSKIPAEIGKLRIVQISDVHLGLIVREERLRKILAQVKKAGPDILVSTGDLVDGQINNLDGLSELLKEINPRYGKFAITGNHEFYAGIEQALAFTRKAGFTILRGEQVNREGLIAIAGVDDPQSRQFDGQKGLGEKELLEGIGRNIFTLLLKHRPFADERSIGLFDLQLSGHVHRGQIFPFSIVTGIYYSTQSGLARLSDTSQLYVSRGSGTWGPPIRFLSRPEVTVIDLVHSAQ